MEQNKKMKVEICNTKNLSSTKKYRNWMFVLNNYTKSDIKYVEQNFDVFVFQEEIGIKGTKHLQGFIILKNPRTFSGLKKELGDRYHIEKARSKKACIKYCTKLESRNGKIYSKGIELNNVKIDYMEGKVLYPWQKLITDIVEGKVHHRKVYWIWERTGNAGKSSLARHLIIKYGALVCSGKAKDIYYAIAQRDEKNIETPTVVFDICRSNRWNIDYEAIENLKNGFCFSGKYESKQVLFNIPHVIIFANSEPDYDKLSKDRWCVIGITGLNQSIKK